MIELREVWKRFGTQEVLRGASLKIETGEAVVVIGRSGGGKSILLKHIIGLLQPDSGEVLVAGENLTTLKERQLLDVRGKFGMLFQMAALFDSMDVFGNVSFGLRREKTLGKMEMRRRVAEALEMVDLPGIEKKMPSELSGGMRKRVGLARAIVYHPQIILYDEPTTGLDPIAAGLIDELIRRIWQQLKVTSIAVTHDMKSARTISDRLFMLHEGRIYADGPTTVTLASEDPVIYNFVHGIDVETMILRKMTSAAAAAAAAAGASPGAGKLSVN